MTSTTTSWPFPAVWLRDNCPCAHCQDPVNHQKLFAITELGDDVAVARIDSDGDEVVVTFGPDGHVARFERSWLDEQTRPDAVGVRSERFKQLWRAEDTAIALRGTQWEGYLADSLLRLATLRQVQRLGFAILHDTPCHEGAVLEVVNTFGYVRTTNYGELFNVRVVATPNNLAFTGLAIGPHTDNPYRDPVPTMQLLHCLANSVEGGESGLVDGFLAASLLREEDPEHFRVLTTTPATFAWSDGSNALCSHRPLIELDEEGGIHAVRFNNRSLQPLRRPYDELVAFYDAYRAFARVLERPELLLTFRLEPGDCLIFDNTRLLHARTAFTESAEGRRHLQGCYSDLEGLDSTVAVLERAR